MTAINTFLSYVEIDDNITHPSGICGKQLQSEPRYGEKTRITSAFAHVLTNALKELGINPYAEITYPEYLDLLQRAIDHTSPPLESVLADVERAMKAHPIPPLDLIKSAKDMQMLLKRK